MDIWIKGTNKDKYVGNTKNGLIIPAIGTRINIGYNPAALILDVVFDYVSMVVFIVVDGPILN